MQKDFQTNLKKYANVAINVGLNLQPGQRLILHHLRYGGIPIQSAPLVRELTASAYRAGARLVDVLWRDDEMNLIRFNHAPRDSFEEYPSWQAKGILEVIENGGAMLTISSFDPDLLEGQDQELVNIHQKTFLDHWKPISDHISQNTMNWSMVSCPIDGWARKVFPNIEQDDQIPALWDALFEVCRIYEEDPVAAWEEHLTNLGKRADYLNQKSYRVLQYKAPGTDLKVGLPEGHIWRSAGFKTKSGIPFTANMPTEEVFTLPEKRSIEGKVSSARPLAYSGNVIDDFTLIFNEGKVVDFSAKRGKQVLNNLLNTDEGAMMIGEVALVPNSTPISQSGLLFYSTLLDENASCHLALGNAYRFSLEGGEKLTNDEFASRGGNSSLVHVDFMIGSGKLDIDGVLKNGKTEPVMRGGEWAF